MSATLILGESGSGKSTSTRNLDPKSTFILNVLDKPLPFRGYKSKYNIESKNYHASDDYRSILNYILAINERRPEINVLILDDFQYLMANEFMGRSSERGFDKFTEIAAHAWQIIMALTETRADLRCFVLTHSDLDAQGKSKIKTIGKMLDDKIALEGMFTVILHSMVVDDQYKFLTQNDGSHMAKSPMTMFNEKLIDNDLVSVIRQMSEYDNYEESDSEL